MSPRSLVFSSDEETSRKLDQALRELDLDVELCPEIFAAIEKITSRKFDVIATDWDEGLEASFLLKTSRELKSNQSALTIAITSSASSIAAGQAGADLVLTKPILVDQAKYAMLTCDEFLSRMKTWLPRQGMQQGVEQESKTPAHGASPVADSHLPYSTPGQRPADEKYIAKLWPERMVGPSTAWRGDHPATPGHLIAATLGTLESDPFHLHQSAGIQTIFSSGVKPIARKSASSKSVSSKSVSSKSVSSKSVAGKATARNRFRSFLRGTALGVAFLSVGYAFSEPARSQAVAVSVAKIYEQAVEKTHDWLHTSSDPDDEDLRADASQANLQQAGSRPNASSRIRVSEVHNPSLMGATLLPTESHSLPETQSPPSGVAAPSYELLIPESLKVPIEGGAALNVNAKTPNSLLGGLEPVNLSSDVADKLLLQRVQPSYPTSALQAGLQGPVVLQAWIGRDGSIRDLKLLNGPLLLGQAAFHAVKQWRYKPYFLNGQAVEAQTLVTVDFRIPR